MKTTGEDSPLQFITLAAWFALLTAIAELSLLAIKKFYLGQMIRANGHIVWMAPVADAAFLAVPAIVLALLSWLRPGRGWLKVALIAFGFYGFFSLSLLYSGLE